MRQLQNVYILGMISIGGAKDYNWSLTKGEALRVYAVGGPAPDVLNNGIPLHRNDFNKKIKK